MTTAGTNVREAPPWFRGELRRRFGEGHDCEWDAVFNRWCIVSPSPAGRPTRQLVVWRRDPATGVPLNADKTTVLPYRELTLDCQWEILGAMEQTGLTNREDGAGTVKRHLGQVEAHNDAVEARMRREDAQLWVDVISEVDLRRPWFRASAHAAMKRRLARRST